LIRHNQKGSFAVFWSRYLDKQMNKYLVSSGANDIKKKRQTGKLKTNAEWQKSPALQNMSVGVGDRRVSVALSLDFYTWYRYSR